MMLIQMIRTSAAKAKAFAKASTRAKARAARAYRHSLLTDTRGSIGISFTILAPLLIYVLWLGFDSSIMIMKHSRLDDATREANLAASALQDEDEKYELADRFIRAYFSDDTRSAKEFSDIEQPGVVATRLESSVDDASFILPQGIDSRDYKLATDSAVISSRRSGDDTDYAIAIDFSTSMSADGSFDREGISRLCASGNEDYDEDFCSRLISSNTNLNISQAVVHQILKILARYNSDTARYALIPFSKLTQASRRYSYTGGGYPDAKRAITPYVFQPQYRLDNYDKYADNQMEAKYGRFILKDVPKSDVDKRMFENLFTVVYTQGFSFGLGSNSFAARLDKSLSSIIDYGATFDNMFNLRGGFAYNLVGGGVNNTIFYYNIYTESSEPRALISERRGGFIASETPLKPLKKIRDFKTDPITDPDDIRTLNATVENLDWENEGLNLGVGLMRGGAHLASGNNARKVLVLITDGATNGSSLTTTISNIERSLIVGGLCSRLRSGLRARGAREVKIIMLVIASRDRSREFLSVVRHCTDESNIVFAQDLDKFFESFKELAFGQSNNLRFIYDR